MYLWLQKKGLKMDSNFSADSSPRLVGTLTTCWLHSLPICCFDLSCLSLSASSSSWPPLLLLLAERGLNARLFKTCLLICWLLLTLLMSSEISYWFCDPVWKHSFKCPLISYNLKNELLPPNLDDEDTGCSEKTARDVLQVKILSRGRSWHVTDQF